MRYELYIDSGGWAHRLHPITKMVALAVIFITALLFSHPLFLLPLFLFILILPFTTSIPSALRRFAFPLIALAIICFLLWTLLSYPMLRGTLRNESLILGIPQRAFIYASAMTLRIITMVLAGIVFFATTTTDELCTALVKMRVPQSVAFALTLSLRLFPAFVESALRILDAQRSRGLRISGNPIRRTVAYVPLIIPVFINSLQQIHRLSLAIEARGYNPTRRRTFSIKLSFGIIDTILVTLSLSALVAAITVRLLIG